MEISRCEREDQKVHGQIGLCEQRLLDRCRTDCGKIALQRS